MSARRSDHHLFALLSSPRALIACGIFFAVAMLSISIAILYGGREDAREHAASSSRNMLLVVERDITRNIQLYDLSLQAVVDGVRRPDVMAAPVALRRDILFDRSATAPYLEAIFVTDAAGRVIIDSRSNSPSHTSLANQDYFKVQRDQGAWGLYLSTPRASPMLNGNTVVFLSRRITDTDGSFRGIVVGAVDVAYFRHLLSGLTLGSHGIMGLAHADGVLIMRAPYNAKQIGLDLRNNKPFVRMMTSSEGSFSETSSIDGIRRIYTFEHFPGLPLIMTVAPAEMDIYAEWEARAEKVAVAMALLCGAFIGLAIWLVHVLGKQAEAESALRKLARTDSLTGLANRRTLDEILEREWRRAVRANRPLSILFIDLDHFKAYNDFYGHQAGDDVLAAVGRCLAEHLRRSVDVAARYGGEEFVVVLPDTDSIGALSVAESLRDAVAALAIDHAASGQGVVTVSIGAATWQGVVAESVSCMVKAADQALYRAKAIGRNCVSGAILG